MDVWQYQYHYNTLYQAYCNLLGETPHSVKEIEQIPFLPIVMFRDHGIKTGEWEPVMKFMSSGTSGSIQSKHLVRDLELYHRIAQEGFARTFGGPGEFAWLGLLPSYIERTDSSLIDMVHFLMNVNPRNENNFFPIVDEGIISVLRNLAHRKQKTILIGVSFALLDLFGKYNVPVWEDLIVIETGGMKGRGEELTRDELHKILRADHPDMHIASEYGMTELFSQAYLTEEHFIPGAAMKVMIRDISDPLSFVGYGQRGGINIIDLANLDTCAFIATDDVGISYADGTFDVLGRLDQSDVRGCNLMYA